MSVVPRAKIREKNGENCSKRRCNKDRTVLERDAFHRHKNRVLSFPHPQSQQFVARGPSPLAQAKRIPFCRASWPTRDIKQCPIGEDGSLVTEGKCLGRKQTEILLSLYPPPRTKRKSAPRVFVCIIASYLSRPPNHPLTLGRQMVPIDHQLRP